MGMTKLGCLPARLRWRMVVDLLDQSPGDSAAVAADGRQVDPQTGQLVGS